MKRLVILLTLIITACQPSGVQVEGIPVPTDELPPHATATQASHPTARVPPTPVPSEQSSIPVTSSPTPAPCQEETGQILRRTVEDDGMVRPLEYRVYLPPCYADTGDEEYPVLYLLHGLQQTDVFWDDLGVDEQMNELIASEAIPPIILVMPWERTGIDIEQALTQVLMPAVDAEFRTCGSMDCQGIGGISRGAGWALRIALHNPGFFRFVGLHSPAMIDGPVFWSRWVKEMTPDHRPTIWIDIGDEDTLLQGSQDAIKELKALGLSVRSSINLGNHDQAYWMENMADYLRWYAHSLSYRLD